MLILIFNFAENAGHIQLLLSYHIEQLNPRITWLVPPSELFPQHCVTPFCTCSILYLCCAYTELGTTWDSLQLFPLINLLCDSTGARHTKLSHLPSDTHPHIPFHSWQEALVLCYDCKWCSNSATGAEKQSYNCLPLLP